MGLGETTARVVAGLLMALPLFFVVTLWLRKGMRTWWAFLGWAAALWVSAGTWGVLGMSYEDFDQPFPVWWFAGLGVSQICVCVALAGAAWRLWKLWRSRRTGGS